jgi:type IV fimbrial biogenesis protein FimT
MRRIKRRVVGLTLIELLITLFIASLLASMTLPGLRDLLDRFKLQRACSEFRSALALTRSEAIRRGVRVDLVPAAAGDWRNGWLVLIDTNNNQRADVGEAVLHQGGVPPEGLHIVSSLRDPKPSSSAVPQIGSLLFTVGSQQRKIVVGFLGRVRSCDPARDGAAC